MILHEAKLTRRNFVASLTVGFVGWAFGQQSITQRRTSEDTEGQKRQPCDETPIIPNTKPQFKIGQVFKYKSSIIKGSGSKSLEAKEVTPGKIVIEGELVPLRQTITIGAEKKHAGEMCFLVERTGIVESPLSSSADANSAVRSVSYISRAGKILYTENTEIVKSGGSTSESTSNNSDLPVSATLHYFFGYWMLALARDFSWECEQEVTDGERSFKSIRVIRTERIDGRECFVVEFVQRRGSQNATVTTYWVDAKERVSVQVRKGNILLKRIL